MDVFSRHHSAIHFNDTLKYDSQILDKTVTTQQTFESDTTILKKANASKHAGASLSLYILWRRESFLHWRKWWSEPGTNAQVSFYYTSNHGVTFLAPRWKINSRKCPRCHIWTHVSAASLASSVWEPRVCICHLIKGTGPKLLWFKVQIWTMIPSRQNLYIRFELNHDQG